MKASLCIISILFGSALLAASSAEAVNTDKAILELMRTTYDLDRAEYEIEVTANQLKTRYVDPADLTLEALSRKEPLGPFTVLVEITSNGNLVEKGQVRMRVRRFAQVLVASDKINRHDHLNEEKFELKRVDVTSLREQPVSSMTEIAGQRMKRNLRLGSILTIAAMEPVPDIDVGGEVTIVFTDTWGSITAPGRSMQSGSVGDRVRVKNLASGKVINTHVVSPKKSRGKSLNE